jgi:hypothetical protein
MVMFPGAFPGKAQSIVFENIYPQMDATWTPLHQRLAEIGTISNLSSISSIPPSQTPNARKYNHFQLVVTSYNCLKRS